MRALRAHHVVMKSRRKTCLSGGATIAAKTLQVRVIKRADIANLAHDQLLMLRRRKKMLPDEGNTWPGGNVIRSITGVIARRYNFVVAALL